MEEKDKAKITRSNRISLGVSGHSNADVATAAPLNREINPWRRYSRAKMQELEGTPEQR
jgi:hypothetical protein